MTEQDAKLMVELLEGVSIHGWKWCDFMYDEGDSFAMYTPEDQIIDRLVRAIVTNKTYGLPLPGIAV